MRTMSILPERGSRWSLSRLFGSMFGGRRSIIEALGYELDVTYPLMLAKYQRQGVFSRIVNAYPDNIWSRAPSIVGNEDLDVAINGKIEDKTVTPGLAQTVDLYHYLSRVHKLAGIGRYAVLLLGFDDVSSVDQLARPVRNGGRKLMFVQAFGEGDADIVGWNQNPVDPEFGKPELYSLKQNLARDIKTVITVHASRVIHVCDGQLENEFYGHPIGARCYNDCDDLLKVSGGGSEACWLSAYKGLQIDVDKEMQFSAEDAQKLRQEVADFQNGMSRVLRTRGVKLTDIGSDNVNVAPMFNVIVSQISTTTSIPQRIFIGSEAGKLASEQDRQNWAVAVDNHRELVAEPRILRPLVRKLQAAGAVPEGECEFEWPDAYIQSPLERAQTSAQVARSATNMANAMERARGLIKSGEARTVIFAGRKFGAQFGTDSWPGDEDVPVEFPSDRRLDLEEEKIANAKEAAEAAAKAAEEGSNDGEDGEEFGNDNQKNQ
jgi:hypothetical protein